MLLAPDAAGLPQGMSKLRIGGLMCCFHSACVSAADALVVVTDVGDVKPVERLTAEE